MVSAEECDRAPDRGDRSRPGVAGAAAVASRCANPSLSVHGEFLGPAAGLRYRCANLAVCAFGLHPDARLFGFYGSPTPEQGRLPPCIFFQGRIRVELHPCSIRRELPPASRNEGG